MANTKLPWTRMSAMAVRSAAAGQARQTAIAAARTPSPATCAHQEAEAGSSGEIRLATTGKASAPNRRASLIRAAREGRRNTAPLTPRTAPFTACVGACAARRIAGRLAGGTVPGAAESFTRSTLLADDLRRY
ncbi:hypothetical protein LUW76_02900 [Actinomadura madurae]|uniref:hypothetical protein n=1 Tax=Actinomadura madurae TaxID=1993 RepID=UPI0020275821|nr:hypothetical protein [Actinomadura madurae]URM93362.1 hypothetical protein LUW76_02900 [Actinomadura madurae]